MLPTILPTDSIIVVIGLPATGKTFVTHELIQQLPNHSVYHTDDYIHFGFEESLYKLMSDLAADENPKKIIEGIQGYRLLRKGMQLGTFKADLIITCQASGEARATRYDVRGQDFNKVAGMDKSLQKIWSEYYCYLMPLEEKPRMEVVDTTYN